MVRHIFRHPMVAFWRERRERGADFALTRTSFEEWSRLRAAAYLFALPLLPLLQLARGCRDALRCGWGMVFILTAPVQFLGHLGWSLGEAKVHWKLLTGIRN